MVSKVNRYYVYTHFHPQTKEVVYVGKGTAHRAWLCEQSRTTEHKQWIADLTQQGFTPGDFARIEAQGLDNKSALEIERELTEEYKNSGAKLFNLHCYGRKDIAVLTPEQILMAGTLRSEGVSYSKIALQLGFSTMTIWRALNGKTKSYQRGAANGQ